MRPDELARARFGTAELVAEHPPELRDARKRLLLELAWPPGYRPGGELEVTRWRARELSAAPGPGRAPEVERRPGFFTYERVGEWHVNFADTHLFGFYGGPLMAQDELQVAEHPTLASLREAMASAGGALAPLTCADGVATPVLVRGAERRLAIDTTRGLYGNAFARATPAAIRAAVQILEPARPSWIIAMAAPPGGRGAYSRSELLECAQTATTAFAAARAETPAGQRAIVHTGNWGCGAFGGDRVLMIAVQLVAAELAGLDRLVLHAVAPKVWDAARALAARLPRGREGLLDGLERAGFVWGQSDGN